MAHSAKIKCVRYGFANVISNFSTWMDHGACGWLVGWLIHGPMPFRLPIKMFSPPLCCCLHLILILEIISNSPREEGKSPSQFIKSCRRPKEKLNNTRCVQFIEVHRKRWVKFIKTPKKEHMRFLGENVRILSLYFC